MSSIVGKGKTEIPESVVKWLFQVIQPIYKHDPRATFHDSMVTLTQFGQLRPRTRVFTDSDGLSRLLLVLHGVIHGVPILVWLPEDYPATSPLIYIDIEKIDSSQRYGSLVQKDAQLNLSMFCNEWNPQTSNVAQIIQAIEQLESTHLIETPQDSITVAGTTIPPSTSSTLTSPPPLPPKPGQQKVSAHALPPRPKVATPPPSPLQQQAVDLMDSLTLNGDTQHDQLLVALEQLLQELETGSERSMNNEITDYSVKYKDVIAKFNDNLQYQTQAVQYVNDNITRHRESLTIQMKELEEFRDVRLNTYQPPQDVDEIVTTADDLLYNFVSLDLALTDAILLCNELLSKGSLTVDQFVRETRHLGTLQFQTRDAILSRSATLT